MNKEQEQLNHLAEIRSIMERSSRFLSLSGSSGIFAGIFALLGVGVAYQYLDYPWLEAWDWSVFEKDEGKSGALFLLADALLVLLASVSTGFMLTYRKSGKDGIPFWSPASKRLLLNMLIPLSAGGVLCLILFSQHELALIPGMMLLFYGMTLVNAGKYTIEDIRYLGVTEIVLGLLAVWLNGYALLIWAIGFGLFHMVYGIILYNKYER